MTFYVIAESIVNEICWFLSVESFTYSAFVLNIDIACSPYWKKQNVT